VRFRGSPRDLGNPSTGVRQAAGNAMANAAGYQRHFSRQVGRWIMLYLRSSESVEPRLFGDPEPLLSYGVRDRARRVLF
jgi:hypothetical protein